MPIPADANIPTVAGYVQVVSFHLLSRNGEKIDIEDASFIVNNITELDALLSLEGSPDRPPEAETKDGANPSDPKPEETKPELANAVVLIKHDLNSGKTKYEKWKEFCIDASGENQTKTEQPLAATATTWSKFAYNETLNPSTIRPCHSGLGFNRKMSFVDVVAKEGEYSVGDVKPSLKIELESSQDNNLLSTTNELTINGTVSPVTKNDSSCTLGTQYNQEFKIKGWQFNANDYPKESTTAPASKVKLLWLAGFEES